MNLRSKWELAYSLSDPENLTCIGRSTDGAYRGFGAAMTTKGIITIRETNPGAIITSNATTKVAAIIKTKLGFAYSPI